MFIVVAPASITFSTIATKKFISERAASSALNSTLSHNFLANLTALTAVSRTFSFVDFNLYFICISDVAIKV